ncbi:MAG TPA: succinate dehydrogenase assembly factor 2 [Burkholderiaceae bacterium]
MENVVSHQLDPANRARLRWRSRRGLLENDLILTRFLDAHEATLTDLEVDALTRLLDLSDNDLMDLILARKEPQDAVDLPAVHALLARLRAA